MKIKSKSESNINKFREPALLLGTAMLALLAAGCQGSADESSGKKKTAAVSAEVSACMKADGAWVDKYIGIRGDVFTGGRMYDQWWDEISIEAPTTDHPLWATRDTEGEVVNNSSGTATWSCSECHGWDYKGKDGFNGPGAAHYTGFDGILQIQDNDIAQVFCSIKSMKDHNFGEILEDREILDLTAFITDPDFGMQDLAAIYNDDLTAKGDAVSGADLYSGAGCDGSSCHGSDGKAQEEWLGDLSNENPAEFSHKVLFGHAGQGAMPAFEDTPDNFQLTVEGADILAYSQTLPQSTKKDPGTQVSGDVVLGGLLYDHWIDVLGPAATTPTSLNPLYARSLGTNVPTIADSWRCKECHGWDYKGKDGAYGSGSSHYTGFMGIAYAKDNKTAAQVQKIIAEGFIDPANGQTVHKFGQYLSPTQLSALAAFVFNGVIDDETYIGSTTGVTYANPIAGKDLYVFSPGSKVPKPSCSGCHGANGNTIDFSGNNIVNNNCSGKASGTLAEYLADMSGENPWEALHKTRFGQPGVPEMPSVVAMGYTDMDAADIVAYIQTLAKATVCP